MRTLQTLLVALALLAVASATLPMPVSQLRPSTPTDAHVLHALHALAHADVSLDTAGGACPHTLEPVPVPLSSPVPAELAAAIKRVDAGIAGVVDPKKVPGVAWTLFTSDQVLAEGMHGAADWTVDPPVPPSMDTLWRIASVTKALTSEMLAEQVATSPNLHWDTPIAHVYPAFAPPNPWNNAPLRLRHLASHTGGLAREAWCGGSLYCPKSLDDIVKEEVNVLPLIVAPDTWPSYSNLGFSLLGNILAQHVAKQPAFDTWATAWLRARGMASTGVGSAMTPDLLKRLAPGWDGSGKPVAYADQGFSNPCGGAFSSLTDLRGWIRSLLAANASDPVDLRRFTEQYVFVNPDNVGYWGTPWETWTQNGYMLRNKGGNLPGATTLVSFIPELNIGLVFAANAAVDEFALSRHVWDILIPALTSSYTGAAAPEKQPPRDLSAYLGVYAAGGITLPVVADGQGGIKFGAVHLAFQESQQAQDVAVDVFRAQIPSNVPLACMDLQFSGIEGAAFDFVFKNGSEHADFLVAPGLLLALAYAP